MSLTPSLLIDLTALQANYRALKQRAAPAACAAMVKANAYGLGAAPVGKALYQAGCRMFFVAVLGEAVALRNAIPADAEIAVLHGLATTEYDEALAYDITPVLNSLAEIESWAAFARQRNKKLPAFVHLDTGMNRLGLPPDEQKRLIASPQVLNALTIKSWMSHLACADEFDKPMTLEQRDKFKALLAKLPPAPASLCNSSGIFWGADYIFDMVRPGIALYGGNPTPRASNPMQPVVELHAPILQIRDVDTPMTVGYGASHRIARKGRIATLALGYADGYLRALGNRGQVKIGEFLAPVVGRISMDLITVDVTSLPRENAAIGMHAVVIGPHRPIDAVALEAGTISYEILTSFGTRFERFYKTADKAS
jgi:alanine racemase